MKIIKYSGVQDKRELGTDLWSGWCFGKTCSWRNWPNRFLREVSFRQNGEPELNSQYLTFIIWFIFLCLNVLHACLSVHHMGVSRPEERVISPGIRITELLAVCECLELISGPMEKQPIILVSGFSVK